MVQKIRHSDMYHHYVLHDIKEPTDWYKTKEMTLHGTMRFLTTLTAQLLTTIGGEVPEKRNMAN